jgi:hypothetical protein
MSTRQFDPRKVFKTLLCLYAQTLALDKNDIEASTKNAQTIDNFLVTRYGDRLNTQN